MSKKREQTMSCIVNAAAATKNISKLSEDYLIYHNWVYRYDQDAGHGCHEFHKEGAIFSHPMLDTCCNNWQNVVNQSSRGSPIDTDGKTGVPTETLDIMLVEHIELSNKTFQPKEGGLWPKGSQKILPIGM